MHQLLLTLILIFSLSSLHLSILMISFSSLRVLSALTGGCLSKQYWQQKECISTWETAGDVQTVPTWRPSIRWMDLYRRTKKTRAIQPAGFLESLPPPPHLKCKRRGPLPRCDRHGHTWKVNLMHLVVHTRQITCVSPLGGRRLFCLVRCHRPVCVCPALFEW